MMMSPNPADHPHRDTSDIEPHPTPVEQPTRRQINRWRKHLANERAEGAVYRELARKKTGEERDILLAIAEAEARHEKYWRKRLGEHVGMPRQASLSTRIMAWMARHFGSVFVLAMMQTAETRNDYVKDTDATEQMIADEAIHAEVVRGLAARGRAKMSGDFRAAIFGANDGLVSNLALVLGMVGTGVNAAVVLVTGLTGLLAGALSMAAGEYVSVSSQKELLDANTPAPEATESLPKLDMEENELELVYRARGMSVEDAKAKAQRVFEQMMLTGDLLDGSDSAGVDDVAADATELGGSGLSAAISSFLCFGVGALIPVMPYIFGMEGMAAAVTACVLVGIVLLMTGAIVGVLSGVSPAKRAGRQLLIGYGAAAVTYVLGMAFGVSVG
nr:VIT1/CCC1 transporter family protein [Corynebacterium anserum]